MFTYDEARHYIHSAEKHRPKPGLLRMAALLEELGNPQNACQYVHVAGTNGKGSTTAMIAAALQEAGYTTGLYISPYIEEFEERISVSGETIPKEVLTRLVWQVAEGAARGVARDIPAPSEFEIITATAFLYFKERGCQLVALETGLGGRFDATNVILPPPVSVLTSISLDHMKTLGDDVVSIFKEKWGIVKPNSTVILYPRQKNDVFAMAQLFAKEREQDLRVPDLTALMVQEETLRGTYFTYKGYPYLTPLIGEHQIYNTMTAIEALQALREHGFPITEEQIAKGISRTRFMGRFEILGQAPLVVLDGGHNENGVEMLRRAALRHLKSRGGRLITVMGMLFDKSYALCIPKIAAISDVLIACTIDNPRSLPGETLLTYGGVCPTLRCESSVEAAIGAAMEMAAPEDSVLICGSLYLIGDARKVMLGKELVPFAYGD